MLKDPRSSSIDMLHFIILPFRLHCAQRSRRVQRLRESGIMQIVAVTDPLQLGFTRQAMIGISVEGDVRRVAEKLTALPEVDYVVMCAGSFDLLVEVVCEDDDALFRLLNDSIRAIPGVRGTESFVYLKLAKQTYSWGTR